MKEPNFSSRVDLNAICFLVSCVGQKQAIPSEAEHLYSSAWFQKARQYVVATRAPWFILSAEHGLIHPQSVIAPYEKTLNTMGVADRKAWASRVVAQMDTTLPNCSKIVVFAGTRYREFLMEYLKRRAPNVEVPLEGLRIGEQLAWFGAKRSSS